MPKQHRKTAEVRGRLRSGLWPGSRTSWSAGSPTSQGPAGKSLGTEAAATEILAIPSVSSPERTMVGSSRRSMGTRAGQRCVAATPGSWCCLFVQSKITVASLVGGVSQGCAMTIQRGRLHIIDPAKLVGMASLDENYLHRRLRVAA